MVKDEDEGDEEDEDDYDDDAQASYSKFTGQSRGRIGSERLFIHAPTHPPLSTPEQGCQIQR